MTRTVRDTAIMLEAMAGCDPKDSAPHNVRGAPIAFLNRLLRNDVDRSQLRAVLGILLGLECDLLTLVQRLEALGLNCRKVNEHIISAIVVGNEAVSLFSVEPLHCSGVHLGNLHLKILYPKINTNCGSGIKHGYRKV